MTDQSLDGDHDVTAWSGYYFGQPELSGKAIAVLGGSPRAGVGPPLLSGHGLDAPGEVVLGAATFAQLHKHVGDSVEVTSGLGKSSSLKIVGTATMPAIGGQPHTEMGTGALLDYHLIPAADRNCGRRHAAHDAATLRTTPLYLALALAASAVAAIGLTLVATVRRRRRELAMLKVLGFTQRQLAIVVACQATVAAEVGSVVGIPLGIVAGRELWTLFARSIDAVPPPFVPAWSLVLVAIGSLVFANLVAALPGRSASKTPTALVLRSE